MTYIIHPATGLVQRDRRGRAPKDPETTEQRSGRSAELLINPEFAMQHLLALHSQSVTNKDLASAREARFLLTLTLGAAAYIALAITGTQATTALSIFTVKVAEGSVPIIASLAPIALLVSLLHHAGLLARKLAYKSGCNLIEREMRRFTGVSSREIFRYGKTATQGTLVCHKMYRFEKLPQRIWSWSAGALVLVALVASLVNLLPAFNHGTGPALLYGAGLAVLAVIAGAEYYCLVRGHSKLERSPEKKQFWEDFDKDRVRAWQALTDNAPEAPDQA